MKKIFSAFAVLFFMSVTIQAGGKEVKHTFKAGETLWFLSQVYYGDGNEYLKIVVKNHLPSAEDVHDGMELTIPEPKWDNSKEDFQAHYKELWDKREAQLHHKAVAQSKKSNRKPSSVKESTETTTGNVFVVPIHPSPIGDTLSQGKIGTTTEK